MATDGGISDPAIINETRPRGGVSSGWATLGNALGGGLKQNGEMAYESGMRMGAQTIDALAQAKDRIQKTQMAAQAGDAIEGPLGTALGLPDEEKHYLGTAVRTGVMGPDGLTKYMLERQQYKQRAALADPTVNPDVRLGSALALDPAGAVPKAEGPLGTVIAPLSPGYNPNVALSQTNSPVSVGGPQMALTQSQIDENKAKAAAAPSTIAKNNAETGLAGARATALTNPAMKPPLGMRIKLDPDTLEPVLDATKRPIFEPIPGVPQRGEGAVNARYSQNMLGAASGAARELENVSSIGDTTSIGGMSLGRGHGGVLDTLSTNLGRAVSSDDQQRYQKSMVNIGRFVGTLENGGRVVPGSMGQMIQGALESYPGDTENSRLYGLALARQALEAQQDRIEASGASQDVKDAYAKEVKRAQAAIPFTPIDINTFTKAPPGTKLADWLAQRRQAETTASQNPPVGQGGGATAPASNPPPGLKLVN